MLSILSSCQRGEDVLFSYKEEEDSPLPEKVQSTRSSPQSIRYTQEESPSPEKHSPSTRKSEIQLLPSNLRFLPHPRRLSYLSKPCQILPDRQKPDSCRATLNPAIQHASVHAPRRTRLNRRLFTRLSAPDSRPTMQRRMSNRRSPLLYAHAPIPRGQAQASALQP